MGNGAGDRMMLQRMLRMRWGKFVGKKSSLPLSFEGLSLLCLEKVYFHMRQLVVEVVFQGVC